MFLAKVLVFLSVLVAISLIIEKELDKTSLPQLADLEKSLGNRTDIIFFGDSTMRYTGPNDTDQRTIGGMLSGFLGSRFSVSTISSNAYNFGVYEAFSNYICGSSLKPKVVIMPVNLRSFSQEWDTRPEYQFTSEVAQIQNRNNVFLNLWSRFYRVFGGAQKEATEASWAGQTVYYNTTPAGKVVDFNFKMEAGEAGIAEKIRKKFIYHYLYNLNSSHRKVVSLANTINNYNGCGVRPLIYITPVDYQNGEKYLPDFKEIVEHNIWVVTDSGKSQDVEIVNMAFDLEPENFAYELNPNEHLNQKGRIYIAGKLAGVIKNS